jgi:hypothetical protein
MATKVTQVALTSTITESISLNGKSYGNTITKSSAVAGEVYQRVMNVSTAEVTILTFGTTDAAGQIVGDSLEYLRVTNLDDTNFVTLAFKTAAEHFSIKLDKEDSYVIMSNQMNAEGDTGIGTLEDMISLTAKANGAEVDIEFVAVTT